MGIEVVMVTGDNERTAETIGRQAGVDRVIAGVLPEGKENVIRQLQKAGTVAMVGGRHQRCTGPDPGLIWALPSELAPMWAIDSADIVLMNSRLTDVSAAVRLSRGTVRNIHENLFLGLLLQRPADSPLRSRIVFREDESHAGGLRP